MMMSKNIYLLGVVWCFYSSVCFSMSLTLANAVFNGDVDGVNQQLTQHPELVNKVDEGEWSFLHVASFIGHEQIVRILLKHGALVNNFYDAESSLHLAATRGHLNIVDLLLSYGAWVNFKNGYGQVPESLALRNGHNLVAAHLANFKNRFQRARIESLALLGVLHWRLGVKSAAHILSVDNARSICEFLRSY